MKNYGDERMPIIRKIKKNISDYREETFDKNSIDDLKEQVKKLLEVTGLSVEKIDEHQYEVVKPSFDADNPIDYVEGMELVNNAFYRINGKVYVWMNEWIEW